MTQVTFKMLADGWFFECSGHSGSDREYSCDIVCAAVSALCLMLARNLEQAESEGTVRLPQYAVADGYVLIEVEYAGGDYEKALTDRLMTAVQCGFDAISEDYGEYLELIN